MDLDTLKEKIIEVVSHEGNKEWITCNITYDFAPFINKGYTSKAAFYNANGEILDFYMKHDLELNDMFYKFIFFYKTGGEAINNQIIFSTTRNDYKNSKIEFGFNKEIEESFQNNLPKSKKGKTLPWWKIESEIIDLKKVYDFT